MNYGLVVTMSTLHSGFKSTSEVTGSPLILKQYYKGSVESIGSPNLGAKSSSVSLRFYSARMSLGLLSLIFL
jgi:hypothetical protein